MKTIPRSLLSFKVVSQIRNQKFNGISLFAINGMDPADFAPDDQIVKIGNVEVLILRRTNYGRFSYRKYAFHLNTAASSEEDGHISLNVINLQFGSSLAG